MDGDVHREAADRLRAVGQRMTPGRRALVDVLAGSRHPLAMPEILAGGRGLAQSSVYRNLMVLEQAGVIRRLVTADDFARFELAEDLTEHHHHLVCTRCGRVEDLDASPALEQAVRSALREVTGRQGFAPQSHRLDVMGVCRRCAAATAAAARDDQSGRGGISSGSS